jgi:ribosomal protein S27AE
MPGPATFARRLLSIETRLRPRCPGCGDHPTRVIEIDGATGMVEEDNFPSGQCPECGRVPFRTLEVHGDDTADDRLVRSSWK